MNFSKTILTIVLTTLLFLGCNPSKEVSSPQKSNISNKVMVLLDRSVQPKKLIKDLATYHLENEGQISRAEYRFMFSFDSSAVDSDKLIEAINALPYASEAAIPQTIDK